MEDSYKHRGLRNKLVKKLALKGIRSESVLKAIGRVPRHLFFDEALLSHAYEDKAFPIGEGQTISQPYTVAFQTEKLDIQPGDKVLEIGTGSGYQAAVLLEMGAKVFSIEYTRTSTKKRKHSCQSSAINPICFMEMDREGSSRKPHLKRYSLLRARPSFQGR
jgi:protein-L-isoaspartate(D-aspartate) O-methyltransferase